MEITDGAKIRFAELSLACEDLDEVVGIINSAGSALDDAARCAVGDCVRHSADNMPANASESDMVALARRNLADAEARLSALGAKLAALTF